MTSTHKVVFLLAQNATLFVRGAGGGMLTFLELAHMGGCYAIDAGAMGTTSQVYVQLYVAIPPGCRH